MWADDKLPTCQLIGLVLQRVARGNVCGDLRLDICLARLFVARRVFFLDKTE